MLGWAIAFFAIAIVAAIFGFGGLSSATMAAAQVMFFVFIVLALGAGLAHVLRGDPRDDRRTG